MKKIKVNLDKKLSNSYDICIGNDILDRVGLIIAKNQPAPRYIVITDSNVSALYGEMLLSKLKKMGLNVDLIEFPAGEASKNISTVLSIVEKMLKIGADRNSILLAMGGGVVGGQAISESSITLQQYMQSVGKVISVVNNVTTIIVKVS